MDGARTLAPELPRPPEGLVGADQVALEGPEDLPEGPLDQVDLVGPEAEEIPLLTY